MSREPVYGKVCSDCGRLKVLVGEAPPQLGEVCRCNPVAFGKAMAPVRPPTGWKCPECNQVNAPSVVQCPCGGRSF